LPEFLSDKNGNALFNFAVPKPVQFRKKDATLFHQVTAGVAVATQPDYVSNDLLWGLVFHPELLTS
jgi:hypothetical protein